MVDSTEHNSAVLHREAALADDAGAVGGAVLILGKNNSLTSIFILGKYLSF